MSLLSFDDIGCAWVENRERCAQHGEDYSVRTGAWYCPEHYSQVNDMMEDIWDFGVRVLNYKKREVLTNGK